MNFSLILSLSRRFLLPKNAERHTFFVSSVAVSSVALGVMALIIALAVLDGFEQKMEEAAMKFSSHIQIVGVGGKPIVTDERIINTIKSTIPIITLCDEFITSEALIRSRTLTDGAVIKGVSVDNASAPITQSRIFSTDSAYEMVIGKAFATKFGLQIGSKVTVFANTGLINTRSEIDHDPIIEQFTITNIYETGLLENDESITFIPINTARRLFNLNKNYSTGLEIKCSDVKEISRVATNIEQILGFPYFSRTVQEIYAPMFSWIDLQKKPIPIVLGLITIVATFTIITALLLLVLSKMRSIAELRSLGMTRNEIASIFLTTGIILGLIGIAIGCSSAFIVCWIQNTFKVISLKSNMYYLDSVPISFQLIHYVIVSCTALLLTTVATLAPSLIASRIRIISALRFS